MGSFVFVARSSTIVVTGKNKMAASHPDTLETNQLEQFEKEELIAMVMELRREKKVLEDRLLLNEQLQLQQQQQYPIEIGVKNDGGMIELFNGAKVEVYGRQLKRKDVAACNRIGKQAVTCKVREGYTTFDIREVLQ